MNKRQKLDADAASQKVASGDLFKLIMKRHEGPGWIVLAEVGNSTGTNAQRHADAIAMGIWPSRGFSLHGYEIKVSREDVKKELRDPSKADAVGQYVDYWWLAISDLSIIDGLEIPESWGILVSKKSALRIHRQAPLRSSKPMDRGFAAAVLRRMHDEWVPRHVHLEAMANAEATARTKIKNESAFLKSSAEFELQRLKQAIREFEKASGVTFWRGEDFSGPGEWEIPHIGEAVKMVLEALQDDRGRWSPSWKGGKNIDAILRREIDALEQNAKHHDGIAAALRVSVERIRARAETISANDEERGTNDG